MNRLANRALLGIFLLAFTPGLSRAGGSHPPIAIHSDTDFATCACVASGTGTTANPYIIGPLSINSAAA